MWKILSTLFLGLMLAAPASAQEFVRLQQFATPATLIDSTSDELIVDSTTVGAFGGVTIQTLDSYTGTWSVYCGVNGTPTTASTYDTDQPLVLQLKGSATTSTVVDSEVGIYEVLNATGCYRLKFDALTGFSGNDTTIVIRATQIGSGGGGGSSDSVVITDGVDTVEVNASNELLVSCADCSGSGVSHVDDAPFTVATDDVVPIAGVFDDGTPDSVNEDDAGAVRMSANRNLYSTIRDAAGNERGVNVTANNELLVELGAGSAAIGTVTVTDGAGALNVIVDSGAVTVSDGAGALNVIVDSGSITVSATNLDVQSGGADLVTSSNFTTVFGTASLILATQADSLANDRDGFQTTTFNYVYDSVGGDWDRWTGQVAINNFTLDGEAFDDGTSRGVTLMARRDDGALDGIGTACDATGKFCTLAMAPTGPLAVSIYNPVSGVALSFPVDAVLGDDTFTEATSTAPGLYVRKNALASLVDTDNEFTLQAVAGTGASWVAPSAVDNGGATPLSQISVGITEDKQAVCTADCNLYSITVTNTNASTRYLKCENDTAANTSPGSETPEFRMAIPATGGAAITYHVGLYFSNALTCWLVTGAADNDVAEVAANEIMVNYGFKQ